MAQGGAKRLLHWAPRARATPRAGAEKNAAVIDAVDRYRRLTIELGRLRRVLSGEELDRAEDALMDEMDGAWDALGPAGESEIRREGNVAAFAPWRALLYDPHDLVDLVPKSHRPPRIRRDLLIYRRDLLEPR